MRLHARQQRHQRHRAHAVLLGVQPAEWRRTRPWLRAAGVIGAMKTPMTADVWGNVHDDDDGERDDDDDDVAVDDVDDADAVVVVVDANGARSASSC